MQRPFYFDALNFLWALKGNWASSMHTRWEGNKTLPFYLSLMDIFYLKREYWCKNRVFEVSNGWSDQNPCLITIEFRYLKSCNQIFTIFFLRAQTEAWNFAVQRQLLLSSRPYSLSAPYTWWFWKGKWVSTQQQANHIRFDVCTWQGRKRGGSRQTPFEECPAPLLSEIFFCMRFSSRNLMLQLHSYGNNRFFPMASAPISSISLLTFTNCSVLSFCPRPAIIKSIWEDSHPTAPAGDDCGVFLSEWLLGEQDLLSVEMVEK